MNDYLFIGIDIGTSSVKALVMGPDYRVRRTIRKDIHIKMIEDTAEQDPLEIYGKVKELIGLIDRKYGKYRRIYSFSSQSPTLIALDEEGKPLTPVISWMDRRASSEAEVLEDKLGRKWILSVTGLEPDAIFTAPKIMWLKRHMDRVFSRSKYFVQLKDYVFYMLTGAKWTDYSHASETMMFNIHRLDWQDEILDAIGISRDSLFEPRQSTDYFEYGKRVFVLGGVDSTMASLGVATGRGDLSDVTGTSTCIDIISTEPVIHESGCFETHVHVIEGKYSVEACLPSAGLMLDRLAELLGIDLEKISFRKNNVVILPFLRGVRSPVWRRDLRALFYGVDVETSGNDIVVAAMESIGFWMRMIIEECLSAVLPSFRRLLVSGGGSYNALWALLKANTVGLPVWLPIHKEASALGAGFLAGIALRYISVDDVKDLVKFEEVYEPNNSLTSFYDEKYHIFKKLFEMILKL